MRSSASLDSLVGIRRLTGHTTDIIASPLHHSFYFGEDAEAVSQIRTATLFCSVIALRLRALSPDYGIVLLLSQ